MKKTIIIVTLFNFFAAGITFVINALLARVFPYEDFGRINVLMSLNVILINLLQFGYSNAVVVFYNKNKDVELDKGLLNFFTKKYVLFLLFLVPVYFAGMAFLDRYYNLTYNEKIFMFSAAFITTLYNFFTAYYQALGRWRKYNFVNVFPNVLRGVVLLIGFLIITLLFKRNIDYEVYVKLYTLYAVMLLVFGILIFNDILGLKSRRGIDSKKFQKLVVSFGIVNIVIAITMRADNIIIERYLGVKEVAIYSAANSLALVFPLITGSIMRVFMKEISKNSKYYLGKIIKFQKKYSLYLVLFIICVVFISPYLVPLVFGDRYNLSISIFQILIITYISGVFFTPIESYFYNEMPKLILIVKVLQMLVLIIFGLVLIVFLGLHGLAIAVFFSRFLFWVFYYTKANNILKYEKA